MDVVTRTPWEFTPEHYIEELQEDNRPVYTLRPMSARHRASYEDLIETDEDGNPIIRLGTLRYEYLRRVVVGARNLPGGETFACEPGRLLDWDAHVEAIPQRDIGPIVNEVKRRTEPREEEAEKS